MAHVGKCIPLKTLAAVQARVKYLEDGEHKNHRKYRKPAKLQAVALACAHAFPAQCEKMLREWIKGKPLHRSRKPKVRAWWWMPRFADGVDLSAQEMRLVEKRLLAAIPKGAIIVHNWHLPLPPPPGRRKKGPDFNFMFSNVNGRGVLKQVSRDSECSQWGVLRDTMDLVVNELNRNRIAAKHPDRIRTMAYAIEQKQKKGNLRLRAQLGHFPDAGDSIETLKQALAKLGYTFTPGGRAGYVRIRRVHCPVLQIQKPARRFKGQGYPPMSLEMLLREVQKFIKARSTAKARQAKLALPALPPTPPATVQPGLAPAIEPQIGSPLPTTTSAMASVTPETGLEAIARGIAKLNPPTKPAPVSKPLPSLRPEVPDAEVPMDLLSAAEKSEMVLLKNPAEFREFFAALGWPVVEHHQNANVLILEHGGLQHRMQADDALFVVQLALLRGYLRLDPTYSPEAEPFILPTAEFERAPATDGLTYLDPYAPCLFELEELLTPGRLARQAKPWINLTKKVAHDCVSVDPASVARLTDC